MTTNTSRNVWVNPLIQIASPVFEAAATDALRERMPVEAVEGMHDDRAACTHLEAVGRALAGIGPWLNLEDTDDEEGSLRKRLREQVIQALGVVVDPASKDFLNFSQGAQPLVDAAFLAQGLLRCWDLVWCRLSDEVQNRLVAALVSTRIIKPGFSNWLLFSAMIEAFLCKAGRPWDKMRVDYAIRQHMQWYKGDGLYGDGPNLHFDHYNSFVIQPMLYDIVEASPELSALWASERKLIAHRLKRYASIQERMIAPDGTFPPIGRSLAYRIGALQALALVAWKEMLPVGIEPAGVRCAMTAVLERLMSRADNFDEKGWLRIGFCGHQPSIGESYISTGSLYLCLCGFLALGLPATSCFWTAPDAGWTSKRIWAGEDLPCDHADD